MNSEQKLQINYDRINTRYNRLWEQLTNIGIFVLAAIVAYLIALSSIERNISTLLTLEQVNYILLLIGIAMGAIFAVFSTYLVLTRKELTRLFAIYEIY